MPTESPAKTRLRLRVTAAAESALRGGHPWLFAKSIREENREGSVGELAVAYDRQNRFLAIGLFDPASPIRMRVLHASKPVTIDGEWWRSRLRAALERRDGLFDAATTGYRCIHGENDGWPGLVLDRYGSAFVLKLYTAAWLPRLEEVCSLVREELKPGQLVLRLSRNIRETAADFGCADGQLLSCAGVRERGSAGVGTAATAAPPTPSLPHSLTPDSAPPRGTVTFLESALRFEADIVRGQKTGFFLDQRENRRRVGALAAGRDVLNAFSFSGGFSLYAARGGARSVMDLDISAHALEAARRNFALNATDPSVARCRHETVRADAFEWIAEQKRSRYDLVILDPPSLAKRETERAGAIRAYAKLVEGGIRVLRAGGVLVAASCSAHVTADEFFGAVREIGAGSGRRFEELAATSHPPDHPATFPEAHYLKCIYLRDGVQP